MYSFPTDLLQGLHLRQLTIYSAIYTGAVQPTQWGVQIKYHQITEQTNVHLSKPQRKRLWNSFSPVVLEPSNTQEKHLFLNLSDAEKLPPNLVYAIIHDFKQLVKGIVVIVLYVYVMYIWSPLYVFIVMHTTQ